MRRLDLSLYAITDERYWNERKMADVVQAALRGGITALQLRNKEADTAKLIEDGLELRAVSIEYNVPLIINDRIDVALEVEADGVHLGQQDASPEEARSILGMSKIIGISVHNLGQATEALELPVDYLGVGSVYSSETEQRDVIGIERLEKICKTVSLPVAAIGGITVERVEEVIKAGASGVAAIGGIWNVEDVEGRVREYVSRLEAIKRSR